MKKKYFKFIQIDNNLVVEFLNKHPEFKKFINPNLPFDVRVSRKPYPGLIHDILCQDTNSQEIARSAIALTEAIKKITARRVNKLTDEQLFKITNNKTKAKLIRLITSDVVSKKLDIKNLHKCTTKKIIEVLSVYPGLTLNTIKQFALFSCFKQDVLCVEDPDFIDGLKIYLNKKDIDKKDIINIEQQFSGQFTLFSLFMWRIKNERNK